MLLVSVDTECMALNQRFSTKLFVCKSKCICLNIEMYLSQLQIVFVMLVSFDTECMALNQQFIKTFAISNWNNIDFFFWVQDQKRNVYFI